MSEPRPFLAALVVLAALLAATVRPAGANPEMRPRLALRRALPEISAIRFSDDGRRLILGSSDGLVLVWDIAAAALRMGRIEMAGPISGAMLSPDGETAFATNGWREVAAWDLRGEGEARELARWAPVAGGPAYGMLAAHVLPGGREGVEIDRDGRISRWALRAAFEFTTVREPAPGEWLDQASICADCRRAALQNQTAGLGPAPVEIYDVESGRRLAELPVGPTGSFLLTPDGGHLLVGGFDGSVRSWPVAGGAPVVLVPPGDESAMGLVLSADGRRLLAGRRVLDARTGAEVCILPVSWYELGLTALSPDGRLLACIHRDGGVRILATDAGTELCRFLPLAPDRWLLHDQEGRFFAHEEKTEPPGEDAPFPVADPVDLPDLLLYWVCGETPIPFEDLSDRLLDPELPRRGFGGGGESPGPPPALPGLPPRIRSASLDAGRGVLTVQIEDLGGGYGALEVRGVMDVFESQISEEAEKQVRVATEAPESPFRIEAPAAVVEIPLAKIPGCEPPWSQIELRTANGTGDLRSCWVRPPIAGPAREPIPQREPRLLFRTLRLPEVAALVPSADGRALIVGRRGGDLRAWDLTTGACTGGIVPSPSPAPPRPLAPEPLPAPVPAPTASEDFPDGEPRPVTIDPANAMALGPGGEQVLTASQDGTALLRQVADGVLIRKLGSGEQRIGCVALSPDGKLAAGGGGDGHVRLWDVETGRETRDLEGGHELGVESVRFSPAGKHLLSSSSRRVCLWDTNTGRELDRYDSETSIRGVALSPGGTEVIVVDWGGRGRLRYLSTGGALPAPSANDFPKEPVTHVAYSPTGSSILSVTLTGEVNVLRATDLEEVVRFGSGEDPIDTAAWLSDGRIATSGTDGLVRLWDAGEGRELCRFGAPGQASWAVMDGAGRFDTSGEDSAALVVVVVDGDPVNLGAYDPIGRDPGLLAKHLGRGAEPLRSVELPAELPPASAGAAPPAAAPSKIELVARLGHSGGYDVGRASPDGRLFLTGGSDGEVLLWEVATGRELRRMAFGAGVSSLCFSPDGADIAVGLRSGEVHLRATVTGAPLATLRRGEEPVNSVEFSPCGRRLLVASDLVALFDLRTLAPVLVAQGRIAALSPDGERILVGGETGSVRLLDRRSGETLFEVAAHLGPVGALAYSTDGASFLTANLDNLGPDNSGARLWNAATGALLQDLVGHTVRAGALEYLPSGLSAVAAGQDGLLRIWDLGTGFELRRFPEEAVGSVDGEDQELGGAEPVLAGSSRFVHDLQTGDRLQVFREGSHALRTIGVSPDGGAILTGCCCTRRWNLWTGQVDRRYGRPFSSGIRGVCFDRTGASVLSLDEFRGALRWWAAEAPGEPAGTLDGALAMEPSGDGAKLHVLTREGQILTLDSTTGAELGRASLSETRLSWPVLSADGRRVAAILDGGALGILSVDGGEVVEIPLFAVDPFLKFSPDGKRLLVSAWDLRSCLLDCATGETVVELGPAVRAAAFSRDGRRLATAGFGGVDIWDTKTGQWIQKFTGHSAEVTGVAFGADETTLWSGSRDHTARLWDVETGRELCTLISFLDGTWAVVDPEGRFDASHGGDVEGLYWVVGNESIALEQLKERFYDPGLLAKITGHRKEPLRTVGAITAPALYPRIEVEPPTADRPELAVHLKNRGGGIGRVVVRINRKEVTADARAPGADPDADAATLHIDLSGDPRLIPGEKNRIEVLVYNAEGYLRSRGIDVDYVPPGAKREQPAELFAIVAGASDYLGDAIDLRFAAKDAADFAVALRTAAARFLGEDHVHLRLLTTDGETHPTRANLLAALEEAKSAKPTDILVLYLSGHGVNFGGEDGDYYYLTSSARSAELGDPEVRKEVALSSGELTGIINEIPTLKQVLILDTCAAGKLVDRLTERRDVPGSQVRALDRLKDRTGLFVLAGCASNRVSFEATRFAQGLLTHSLLMGMKGAALREDEYVDVSTLFGFAADTVPKLAQDIGGIQRPVVASPRGGGSFDLGRLTEEDKARVPLQAARPLFLRSSFQPEEEFEDLLGISKLVDLLLADASARGADAPLVFVDARTFPDACRIAGRYEQVDGRLRVRFRLYQSGRKTEVVTVEADPKDLDAAAKEVVEAALRLLD